jgi:hypothetical protein
MIELNSDILRFSFPEVSDYAQLSINFQRTLRLPDDGQTYPLPPGLGRFPIRHVDDFASKLPQSWIERGGIMLPMYQSEALWLMFQPMHCNDRQQSYPFAIKVSTGKIDAITGKKFCKGVHRDPQDYLVSPDQPWLDGYCVKKDIVRQFVAMPLGKGYTAEEQITGEAEWGGIQIVVYPMKRHVWEGRFPVRPMLRETMGWGSAPGVMFGGPLECGSPAPQAAAMGIAPGGRMKQQIYRDQFDLSDWDLENSARCFLHIANSEQWKEITGSYPPLKPPSASDYNHAGLPWFDYYTDQPAVTGSGILSNLKSVVQMTKQKSDAIEGNQSCSPDVIVKLRKGLAKNQVREGSHW